VSGIEAFTLTALAEAIQGRKLSAVEATNACLDRIARVDGTLRAFITVDAEGALAVAHQRDAELAAGRPRGPLHGVPLAYKDLCHVPGLPTSCGTATPSYFLSEDACTAVTRLAAAGAVTLGKLNMSELASGPFGDNPHHGDVQNPWRAGHVSGGSSSGSAAAVAAGLAFGALGTDTGGSIRLPAACCGIVGLKPTYGRVSRAGAMPLSWSLDHVGPMTRTVGDCALMLSVIAGHDSRDATSSQRPVPAVAPDGGVSGLRVGVAENYYFEGIDAEMASGVRAAIRRLDDLGARVEPLTLPDPESMISIANVVARAEAAAVHHRILRERPQELGAAVRARLGIGLGIAATDSLQALRLRSRLTRTRRRVGPPGHPRACADVRVERSRRRGGQGRAHGPLLATDPPAQRPGAAGPVGAMRALARRPAARVPARGPPLRRGHGAASRTRVRGRRRRLPAAASRLGPRPAPLEPLGHQEILVTHVRLLGLRAAYRPLPRV
jgi:aspartyl-tRNA(Asn)/glutamyl-tRNA(Gln) amidotransferase subunit A